MLLATWRGVVGNMEGCCLQHGGVLLATWRGVVSNNDENVGVHELSIVGRMVGEETKGQVEGVNLSLINTIITSDPSANSQS